MGCFYDNDDVSPAPEWQVQPQLGSEEGVTTTEKTTEKSRIFVIVSKRLLPRPLKICPCQKFLLPLSRK